MGFLQKLKSRNYEVNGIMLYAMRQGMKILLYLINHPAPTTKKAYSKISTNFHNAIKNVAGHTMHMASKELCKLKGNTDVDHITDVGLSFDGAWHKRGYTSLNGFVAGISIDT